MQSTTSPKVMVSWRGRVLAAIAGIVALAGLAEASAQDVPPTTVKVVEALNASEWKEVEPGLRVLRITTVDGLVLTAHGISPEHFRFSIVLQSDPGGERIGSAGNDRGAVLAVNGGFFATTGEGILSPVGYLRVNGNRLSKGWTDAGGFISIENGRLSLSPVAGGTPQGDMDVLQSKPMMIEPGKRWAMRTNQGKLKRRTLLCMKDDGEVVLVIVSRVGMSLYEAGWLMRSPDLGGYFDCASAIALDGGRSSQVYYDGHPEYAVSGFTPVHNFLVVNRRGE